VPDDKWGTKEGMALYGWDASSINLQRRWLTSMEHSRCVSLA
jgi:hypothetical protein